MSNRFLVCGLGSLGQHCVAALEEFGAQVTAIDHTVPKEWEIPGMRDSLEMFFGDCRQAKILEQAGIKECRAILLVNTSEQVNVEVAFIARSLNPCIRLVVMCSKQQLNQALSSHLQNFIALEPDQLPAAAFALAALGEETLGCFKLNGQLIRVIQRKITTEHPWLEKQAQEINHPNLRLLCHAAQDKILYSADIFHDWEPNDRILDQDTVVYIRVSDPLLSLQKQKQLREREKNMHEFWTFSFWQEKGANLARWISKDQIRGIATSCLFLVIFLGSAGTIVFHSQSEISMVDAFSATAILLLGGYGDLFGGFTMNFPLPWWLRIFGLAMSLAGIALTGVLYGLLTESILSLRLQFFSRRPSIPEENHIVIIGLSEVGQQVAHYLQEFHQSMVGIHPSELDNNLLPSVPIVSGDMHAALENVNITRAKSVIAVTDDEMTNLELGLVARSHNSNLELVIRTFEPRFSSHLAELLPHAQVLCAYALSAKAFAVAAYGENVLSIFQLRHHTVLVTEYRIEASDTLNGLLLSEIAYGYGVTPVLHQEGKREPILFPSYDVRVHVGDRMIVLATTDALHRIELGNRNLHLRQWRLCITHILIRSNLFEVCRTIGRIIGCSAADLRPHLDVLPTTLPFPLYKHQGLRLVCELSRIQVTAHLIAAETASIDQSPVSVG